MSGDPGRRADLERNLAHVRDRIAAACRVAGRDPSEVSLVAVTKFFPASDVDLLADLGITAIGENRDQEASAKVAELRSRGDLEVHFIGQLQTNKASSVVSYADVVQSVDRPKLVAALDRAAAARGVRPAVLVQVSLDEPPDRGGVEPGGAAELADLVAGSAHLELRGVMAVAPLGGDAGAGFRPARGGGARHTRRASGGVLDVGGHEW